jgi:hypothetical protein
MKTTIVLALAVAGAAFAQQAPMKRPHGSMRSHHFNLEGSLQRAAHKLLKPPRGTPLVMHRQHDHFRVESGVSFHRYVATDQHDKAMGSFLRMRLHATPATNVDMALTYENGCIVAAMPLQQSRLGGVPMFELHEVVASLSHTPVREYASQLSRVFAAMSYLTRAAKVEAPPRLTPEETKHMVDWAAKERPRPASGAAMPAFTATDATGAALGPEQLKGKPAVILFATVQAEMGRDALSWFTRYVQEKAPPFTAVEVVLNNPSVVEQYRRRGGALVPKTVVDTKMKVHDAFKVGFTPCWFVYDASGQLVRHLAPGDVASYEALAGLLDPVR